jgi:hypothetical protein
MAADTSSPTIQGKQVETVGVILVHGIGEQKHFTHLDSETPNIVDAILADLQARSKDQKRRPEPEVYREPVFDR